LMHGFIPEIATPPPLRDQLRLGPMAWTQAEPISDCLVHVFQYMRTTTLKPRLGDEGAHSISLQWLAKNFNGCEIES
jgi:hypothetical protein